MPRILFLCTGNRARSQLAEGLACAMVAPGVEVASAGTKPNPKGIHPVALAMLREKGADPSRQRPKHFRELEGEFDYVITLCDSAAQECPTFPARRARLHWGLPDPDAAGDDPEKVQELFRQIRDELERRLTNFLDREGLRKRP
jgi:arsenate reductase